MESIFGEYLKRFLPEKRINRDNLDFYEFEGRIFYRLKKDAGEFLRGTVFWDGGFLKGFQRIKRVLVLEKGIERNITGPFYAEEKMDGYNVRLRRVGDTVYAFTRGGFICPFTMDRVNEFIPAEFFERYPDYTLCVEVVGPENPYNSEGIPYMDEDIDFFAFDIKDRAGRSLPVQKRYEILDALRVKSVRRWGPFTIRDTDAIRRIIEELDREGREGLVLKSLDGRQEIKYVTLSSCVRDIRATAHLMSELPGGFYIQRLLRIGAILLETSRAPSEDLKASIGDSFMEGLLEAMKVVLDDNPITETFRVRVNRPETADLLIEHLRKTGTRPRLLSLEKKGSKYLLTFTKTYQKGTKDLRRKLKGYGFYD